MVEQHKPLSKPLLRKVYAWALKTEPKHGEDPKTFAEAVADAYLVACCYVSSVTDVAENPESEYGTWKIRSMAILQRDELGRIALQLIKPNKTIN